MGVCSSLGGEIRCEFVVIFEAVVAANALTTGSRVQLQLGKSK